MADQEARVSRTIPGQPNLNTLIPPIVRLRLFDPFMHPLPGAPYRIVIAERTIVGEADGDGWVEIHVSPVPERCIVEFGRPDLVEPETGPPDSDFAASPKDLESAGDAAHRAVPDEAPSQERDGAEPLLYRYQQEVYLDVGGDQAEESLERRLHNMGFDLWRMLEHNVDALRTLYGRPASESLAQIMHEMSHWHDQCRPKVVHPLDPKTA